MLLQKNLKDYTFNELVQHFQAEIALSIPTGGFNDAIWRAMEMAIRWEIEQNKGKK